MVPCRRQVHSCRWRPGHRQGQQAYGGWLRPHWLIVRDGLNEAAPSDQRGMVWTGEEVLRWGTSLCCREGGIQVDA